MLITNEQREQLLKQFDNQTTNQGGWVIRNNISLKDIEICSGLATADPVTRTCNLCVAANKTAYSGEVCTYDHPNCKCDYDDENVTVQVDFPMSKLTGYLFKDVNKSKMMHKIGYRV